MGVGVGIGEYEVVAPEGEAGGGEGDGPGVGEGVGEGTGGTGDVVAGAVGKFGTTIDHVATLGLYSSVTFVSVSPLVRLQATSLSTSSGVVTRVRTRKRRSPDR